jgi:hypothetical protein
METDPPMDGQDHPWEDSSSVVQLLAESETFLFVNFTMNRIDSNYSFEALNRNSINQWRLGLRIDRINGRAVSGWKQQGITFGLHSTVQKNPKKTSFPLLE